MDLELKATERITYEPPGDLAPQQWDLIKRAILDAGGPGMTVHDHGQYIEVVERMRQLKNAPTSAGLIFNGEPSKMRQFNRILQRQAVPFAFKRIGPAGHVDAQAKLIALVRLSGQQDSDPLER